MRDPVETYMNLVTDGGRTGPRVANGPMIFFRGLRERAHHLCDRPVEDGMSDPDGRPAPVLEAEKSEERDFRCTSTRPGGVVTSGWAIYDHRCEPSAASVDAVGSGRRIECGQRTAALAQRHASSHCRIPRINGVQPSRVHGSTDIMLHARENPDLEEAAR